MKFNATDNRGGRPAGARNKLQAGFLRDLAEAWELEGKGALRIMVKEEPAKFVQVCASLMPREVSLEVGRPLSDMSDEEVHELLARFRDMAEIADAEQEQVLLSAPEVIDDQSIVGSRAKKAQS
jgi:hypothetical protein